MWWMAVAFADQVVVCPTNVDYPGVCAPDVCDYCTLEQATLSGELDIVLAPGLHIVDRAVVTRPDTQISGLDAWILAPTGSLPAISVAPGGRGSRLSDLTLISNTIGFDGPLIEIDADDVVLVRPVAAGLSAENFGIAPIRIYDASGVILEQPVLAGNRIEGGGTGTGVYVLDAGVEIVGGEVSGNTGDGPAVIAIGSTLTLRRTTLVDNDVGFLSTAGQLYGEDSVVSLEDVTVHSPADAQWGAVELYGGTLSLVGGSVSGGAAVTSPGLVTVTSADRLSVAGTRFEDHQQTAIFANGVTEVQITDAVFAGSGGGWSGGAVTTFVVPKLDVDRSWFCSETAESGAGLGLFDSCSAGCSVRSSVFAGGSATGDGAGIYLERGELDVEQSTFLDNEADGRGGAIRSPDGLVNLDHTLIVGSGKKGPAVVATLGDTAYDAFGDNVDSDTRDPLPPDGNHLFDVQPVFVPAGPCGIPVALDGDPANTALVENRVGAWTPCWIDGDGDGWGGEIVLDGPRLCTGDLVGTPGDCDDADAAVFPGGGICALPVGPDTDADGDGVPATEDCNDADPEIGRCSIAILGGCRTAAGPPMAVWVVVALLCRKGRLQTRGHDRRFRVV